MFRIAEPARRFRHAPRTHRRPGRVRRPVAGGTAASVVLSMLVAVWVAGTRDADAAAVDIPGGGLVASESDVGWTTGEFSVADDGAARYSLPLEMPPGRVAPTLALSYNSRAGNGLLGVGWTLAGLSSIGWCPRTYAFDGYTDAGNFFGEDPLCLDGQRLLPMADTPAPGLEYRTERGPFARITGFDGEDGVPNWFKVEAKDGRILTFGASADSVLGAYRLKARPDPGDPTQPDFVNPRLVQDLSTTRPTLAWGLSKIEDRNGNAATVEYERSEAGQDGLWAVGMRPRAIRYAPNRRVEFTYEARNDDIDAFGGGVHTRIEQRLSSVKMLRVLPGGSFALLREYRLGYQYSLTTRRSLLNRIAEYDEDGVQGKVALPLEYSPGSNTFQRTPATKMVDADIVNCFYGWCPSSNTGDVNGDGYGDLIYKTQDPDGTWVQLGAGSGGGFADPVESPDLVSAWAEPFRPADVDLRGSTDVLGDAAKRIDGRNGRRWQLFESDGSRFVEGPGYDVGTFQEDVARLGPAQLSDLDGNGQPDFVQLRETTHGVWDWDYRLNTGGAGSLRFAPVTPVVIESGASARPENYNVQVADTDGDGRTELVHQRFLNDPAPYTRGGYWAWGLDADGDVEGHALNIYNTGRQPRPNDVMPHGALFGDLNGDGLDDAVLADRQGSGDSLLETTLKVQLNSGRGFTSPNQLSPPTWLHDADDGDGVSKIMIADFTGDGRDDVGVELLSGHGTPGFNTHLEVYEWMDGILQLSWNLGDVGKGALPMDYDADGMLDLVVRTDDVDGVPAFQVIRHLGGPPDLLTGIGSLGASPAAQVTYTTLADRDVHEPCSEAHYPLVCPTAGGRVVKEHRIATYANSSGGPAEWDSYVHTYVSARSDLKGRGWLGFAHHTVTRQLTGVSVQTNFDNFTEDAATKTYPYAMLPKHIITLAEVGDGVYSRTLVDNDWKVRKLGASYTVELDKTFTLEQEGNPEQLPWRALRQVTTDPTYDAFGNVDLEVTTNTDGRKVTVDHTFEPDTVRWLIGLPKREVTTGCDAANVCTTRTSAFTYYPNGNLETTVVEPDRPAFKLTTKILYNTLGNPTTVTRTDNAGTARAETFEYTDDNKLHPTATINAAGHRVETTTDPGLGVVLDVRGPNPGERATMRHDKFGRLRETTRTDGSFERITHTYNQGNQVTTTAVAGGGLSQVTVDPRGRETERQVKVCDGRMATTRTHYDAPGRVVRASRPYFQGDSIWDTGYTYDARDRVLSEIHPANVRVTHSYPGLEHHTVDAKGFERYTVENADGDIATSFDDDPSSAGWLKTTFQYDGFGQPTRITAPDDTVEVMHYDVPGRLDELTDPSSGKTTVGYNAFGDVTTRTDATGATTTYQVDALGRVTRAASPDGVETNTWDTAEHGIGKLASADSPDSVFTRFRYDDVGHQTAASWKIGNETFEVLTHYDAIGRAAGVTYPHVHFPDGYRRLRVDYLYNPSGYLNQVRDAAAGGPVYWTANTCDAAGQITKETQGNGVVTDYTYQPATALLDTVTTTGPGAVGKLGELDYNYDRNRNVEVRHDKVNQRYERYTYDAVNRLTQWLARPSATGSPVLTANYTYDRMGNLKTETTIRPGQPQEAITYEYGYENPDLDAPPHALVERNAYSGYRYDDAGRQITGPNRSVTYTTRNLPKALDTNNGRHEQFKYDAAGMRALKVEGAKTVVTAGDLFERRSPAGHDSSEIHNLHNIVVGDRIVAQVNFVQPAGGGQIIATRVLYLHADLQRSTTLVTNANGVPYQGDESIFGNLFYSPWGGRIDANYEQVPNNRTGGPRQLFTGQYHDDEIYLINMKGRMYDPHDHRFLSPDPVAGDPRSSQAHNRYAYVRNNPTTLTDPTGLCPDCSGLPMGAIDDVMLDPAYNDPLLNGVFAGYLPGQIVANGVTGWDEDSGAYMAAGEVIEIRGRHISINEDVYWSDHEGFWAEFRSGQVSFYDNRDVWLAAQHASEKFRGPGSDTFYRSTAAIGLVAGIVFVAECLAIPMCQQAAIDAIKDIAWEHVAEKLGPAKEGEYGIMMPKIPGGLRPPWARWSKISDPNPIPPSLRGMYDRIKLGHGVPRIDPVTGQQRIFQAHGMGHRQAADWRGSLEFDVPGTDHRILLRPDGKMGYVLDHDYTRPHLFPFPWYPEGGRLPRNFGGGL